MDCRKLVKELFTGMNSPGGSFKKSFPSRDPGIDVSHDFSKGLSILSNVSIFGNNENANVRTTTDPLFMSKEDPKALKFRQIPKSTQDKLSKHKPVRVLNALTTLNLPSFKLSNSHIVPSEREQRKAAEEAKKAAANAKKNPPPNYMKEFIRQKTQRDKIQLGEDDELEIEAALRLADEQENAKFRAPSSGFQKPAFGNPNQFDGPGVPEVVGFGLAGGGISFTSATGASITNLNADFLAKASKLLADDDDETTASANSISEPAVANAPVPGAPSSSFSNPFSRPSKQSGSDQLPASKAQTNGAAKASGIPPNTDSLFSSTELTFRTGSMKSQISLDPEILKKAKMSLGFLNSDEESETADPGDSKPAITPKVAPKPPKNTISAPNELNSEKDKKRKLFGNDTDEEEGKLGKREDTLKEGSKEAKETQKDAKKKSKEEYYREIEMMEKKDWFLEDGAPGAKADADKRSKAVPEEENEENGPQTGDKEDKKGEGAGSSVEPVVKKNPFASVGEPTSKLAKKAPVKKKTFGVPVKAGGIVNSTATANATAQAKKPKLRDSKLTGKITINFEEFKLKVMMQANKKKKKLKSPILVTCDKHSGTRYLEFSELFEYFQDDLRSYGITSSDEMLEEILTELKLQLNMNSLSLDWLKHHLRMLSRKYFQIVAQKVPQVIKPEFDVAEYIKYLDPDKSYSFKPSKRHENIPKVNQTLVPEAVLQGFTLQKVLCDLYYRYKREETIESKSVIRRLREGLIPNEQRICLMVNSIYKENAEWTIELTDGWYIIFNKLYTSNEKELEILSGKDQTLEFNNHLMLSLILHGKLRPGDKVEVSYLDLPKLGENEPVYTKVTCETHYNSFKPLPWNAKMGLLYTKPKPSKLASVAPHGGIIPKIDVIVVEKKGVKIAGDKDEYMIKTVYETDNHMQVHFSLSIVDALHICPFYNKQIVLHQFNFRNAGPGSYFQIGVGNRLEIYGLKIKKNILSTLNLVNFEVQHPKGLVLTENRRNNVNPIEIPNTLKNNPYYGAVIDTRKKNYVSVENIVQEMLKLMVQHNAQTGKAEGPVRTENMLITAALKYIHHNNGSAMFHLWDKHFIQIVATLEETGAQERKAANSKASTAKAESLFGKDPLSFWDRIKLGLTSTTESKSEMLIVYDLVYQGNTRVIDSGSRGKIYIHRCTFDCYQDFMLGENIAINNLENWSLEKYLLEEYKKNKNFKLPDGEPLSSLLAAMPKISF